MPRAAIETTAKFTCKECGKECKSLRSLSAHIGAKHNKMEKGEAAVYQRVISILKKHPAGLVTKELAAKMKALTGSHASETNMANYISAAIRSNPTGVVFRPTYGVISLRTGKNQKADEPGQVKQKRKYTTRKKIGSKQRIKQQEEQTILSHDLQVEMLKRVNMRNAEVMMKLTEAILLASQPLV